MSVAVSSVLLLIVARWVIALVLLSGTSVSTSATGRDAGAALAQLRGDVAAAASCDPWDLRPSLVSVNANSVVMWVREAGGPVLVTWSLDEDRLLRGVTEPVGVCDTTGASTEWTTVATGAGAASGRPAFALVRDGGAVAGDVDCAIQDCRAQALAVAVIVTDRGENPAPIDAELLLGPTGGR